MPCHLLFAPSHACNFLFQFILNIPLYHAVDNFGFLLLLFLSKYFCWQNPWPKLLKALKILESSTFLISCQKYFGNYFCLPKFHKWEGCHFCKLWNSFCIHILKILEYLYQIFLSNLSFLQIFLFDKKSSNIDFCHKWNIRFLQKVSICFDDLFKKIEDLVLNHYLNFDWILILDDSKFVSM